LSTFPLLETLSMGHVDRGMARLIIQALTRKKRRTKRGPLVPLLSHMILISGKAPLLLENDIISETTLNAKLEFLNDKRLSAGLTVLQRITLKSSSSWWMSEYCRKQCRPPRKQTTTLFYSPDGKLCKVTHEYSERVPQEWSSNCPCEKREIRVIRDQL
jgi:hypothetical protein